MEKNMSQISSEYYDQIVLSKFFTRLSKKTQMIRNEENYDGTIKINGLNEKNRYQTRSSHTMDVKDCAELISKSLTPSISIDRDALLASTLLHDIGHTPFGHSGEDALNEMFLSNDGENYSDTYPGLFKHNINSLKIIGEYMKGFTGSFSLMDGILKHTSPFPKNYCFSVFKEKNIVKSNFILRYFDTALQENLDDFIYLLNTTSNCAKKSLIPTEDHESCHTCLCEGCSYRFCFNDVDLEKRLSAYICYPYAVTYEGAILYWADEISCFCSDLLDFFKFLQNENKHAKGFIPLAKLNSCISIANAAFPNNNLGNLLLKYKKALYCLVDDQVDIGYVQDIIKTMKTELTNEVALNDNVISKNNIYICYDGKDCYPLLKLNNEYDKIMKMVKNAIYQDLHSITFISDKNKTGKSIIKSLINYYCDNFESFKDDFSKSHGDKLSAVNVCANAIEGITKSKYTSDQIRGFFKSTSGGNSYISDLLKEKEENKEKPANKEKQEQIIEETLIKNVLKREIGYFVATLSEEECFTYVKSHSISY